MLLRMKIILTIWPHENTLSIRANGGFIRTSKVLILRHWRKDLISNKHCLPCNVWNKKQKETHKCLLTLTEINNGHRVLLLHGGIGKVHGGLWQNGVTCWMQYLERFFWTRLSWIQFTLLQMDRLQLTAVYCNRRVGCKHNTSNDPFSRCKSVQYMATGKNWRSQHTVWLQVQKWTKSENSVIGYACVVTLHDYTTDTNDNMTTKTDFHTEHINTNTWGALSRSSCVSASSYIAHAPLGSSRESCVHLSSHPHALMMKISLAFWSHLSLHLLPHAPPVALLPLLHPLEVRRQPAHSAQREYGLHWRDLLPHRLRVWWCFLWWWWWLCECVCVCVVSVVCLLRLLFSCVFVLFVCGRCRMGPELSARVTPQIREDSCHDVHFDWHIQKRHLLAFSVPLSCWRWKHSCSVLWPCPQC